MWRSQAARSVRDAEVGSSSLLTPTTKLYNDVMDYKPKYKLPESMRNQTLDLRSVKPSSSDTNKVAPATPKTKQLQPGPQTSSTQTATQSQKQSQKPSKPSSKANKLKMAGLIILIAACIAGAIYIVFLLLAPKLLGTNGQSSKNQAVVVDNANRITISSVGISAPIIEGDVNSLEKGAWHRLPQQGDPTKGGNFIVTGHSFVWGYTPQQIKEKSIFYNLPDVKNNDTITIKWDGKDYKYKVTDIKKVKPNQTEVETQTKDPQLTVYTCTLAGSSDGRVVVIAKPA